jgi:hypothetical protein
MIGLTSSIERATKQSDPMKICQLTPGKFVTWLQPIVFQIPVSRANSSRGFIFEQREKMRDLDNDTTPGITIEWRIQTHHNEIRHLHSSLASLSAQKSDV